MTNANVDLVCGPADPLPGAEQSYRLTGKLGSGGQADVYQAVRISAGISSTPLTVKVFRLHQGESREHQYRSWDKGDAVLMDLHSRGVGSICRRIDAFYGRMPHRADQAASGEPVPYQVLEYLPGYDLRQLLTERRGRVEASRILGAVHEVMLAMHRPPMGAHPVLHMDLKPANVIVGPDGSAKVIDFTGARYYNPAHLTTIAYTRETAGPEAHEGRVGPAYDVHGFGSIAFFMVTGASARTDSPGTDSVPWARLRSHPVLEANPRVRDLLTATLDDNPENRPRTDELRGWIDELTEAVVRSNLPDFGVDWGPRVDSAATTQVLGAPVGLPVAAPLPPAPGETRVMNPALVQAPVPAQAPVPEPVAEKPQPIAGRVRVPDHSDYQQGRAGDVQRRDHRDGDQPERDRHQDGRRGHDEDPQHPLLGPPGSLARGLEFSIIGGLFSLIMWLLLAFQRGSDSIQRQAVEYLLILAVAIGLFFLLRVAGGMFWGRMLGARRRSARLAHLLTGAFLFLVGMSFLSQLSWGWVDNLFDPADWFSGIGDWFGDLFD